MPPQVTLPPKALVQLAGVATVLFQTAHCELLGAAPDTQLLPLLR